MKGVVYSGLDTGFYCYSSFEKFMEKIKAEHIRSRFDTGNDLFQIWFLGGVLIYYRNNGHSTNAKATITLYSQEKIALEGIEKIIAEEARKYP